MSSGSDHKPGHQLRKMFFTGIIFLVPIGITTWVLRMLVVNTRRLAGDPVSNIFYRIWDITLPGPVINLMSLVMVFFFIVLIGWLASFYLGKRLLDIIDTLMLKLPFVRSIYGATKQVIESFSVQTSGGSFKKVVLLEYPRYGSWVLGFVTSERIAQNQHLLGKPLIGVFVPSTPNPTTGFLLYLEPHEIWVLDLDVEEAIKLIVSAGMVLPPEVIERKRPYSLSSEANRS